MEKHQFSQITFPRRLAGIAIGVLLCSVAAAGQPAPSLGSADSFVILAGTGVVNSGPTQVTGSIGVSAAMPGSPPVVPSPGSFLSGGSTVARAQQANTTLYNDLSGRTCTDPLSEFPTVLLPNRVYCISSGAPLSGRPLRFAGTSSNDLWIIQVVGDLQVEPDVSMLLEGGALSSHVFWTVSGSATLGAGSAFAGNILARNNITFGRGATFAGRALAQRGTVTLDSDAINLCGKLILLSPQTLPPGTVGVQYPATTISASEGDPAYTLEILDDRDLPPGLTFNVTNGLLSGTPTQSGSFHFFVRATDVKGARAIRFYSVDVFTSVIPPRPPTLPPAYVCDPYSVPFVASGGSGQYDYKVTGLPPDLLPPTAANPVIAGIPRLKGDFPIDATVTDTVSGNSVSARYTLSVGCHVTISASVPNGKACRFYKGTLVPSCPGDFTVDINSEALPPGLSLVPSTGEISGIPTTPGTYPFSARIDTFSGCSPTGDYTIIIDPPDPLPTIHLIGTVCIPVNVPIAGTIVGRLPSALLFSDRILQGTPEETGSFSFTVIYDDAKRCPREQSYDITIACPKEILPDDLPHILPFYHPVDIVIPRADLKNCFTYSVDQKTLPQGLTLVGDRLMGLPDTLEKTEIVVTATDPRSKCVVTAIYPLEIVDPPLCEASIVVSPPSMKFLPGTVGVSYPALTFTAGGGTPPYVYDVVVPSLPPGLFLSLAGVLTGIPTTPGRFNFAVRATDAAGTPGCGQVYSIEIGN